MKIVLDTNILRQDLLLRSRKSEMLLDFAAKTRSQIILPQIVYQELESVYEREIARRLNEFQKARDSLRRSLLNFDIPDIEIEIEVQVSQYLAHVCERLCVADDDIDAPVQIKARNFGMHCCG
jgi:predicted nucleic acid-binding protein